MTTPKKPQPTPPPPGKPAPQAAPVAPVGTAATVILAPPESVPPGTLLAPVASDEALVEAFKRYNMLKEKLLEPTDYTWTVGWEVGGNGERQFFKHKAKAEQFYNAMRAKGFEVELEKKIKKSGCMKLSKAFAISDWPVEERLDPAAGFAYYRVRAEAPNGQYKVRTGTCDRQTEKGKARAPFDTIVATALTRAAGRAIMALLGGENTAEEFEGGDAPVDEAAPPPAKPTKAATAGGGWTSAGKTCKACGKATAGADDYHPDCAPAKVDEHVHTCPACGALWGPCADPHKGGYLPTPCAACAAIKPGPVPQMSHEEALAAIDTHFGAAKPAAQQTERQRLNKLLWVAAGALFGNGAEARVHNTCTKRYGVDSITKLTDAQFKELAEGVAKLARGLGALREGAPK